jgi:uncharacterized membrane protein YraQ (UPF0718 family)
VTTEVDQPTAARRGLPASRLLRPSQLELFTIIVVAVLAGRSLLLPLFHDQRASTMVTIFVSVSIQALPYLVLGTLLSATITAFVPTRFFERALPRNRAAAVAVAGVVGCVLPACECGSVPVAAGLARRGVPFGAALAFLLSSPAINPVVLVATATAFSGRPAMVLARLVASLITAVVMGWLWLRLGRPEWLRPAARVDPHTGRGWAAFAATARHDLVEAGGFLVIGAFAAALLNVLVPPVWLQRLAGSPVLAVLALAVLAVVLSICSEADAFVAASLSQFSLTARLAFLTVGPMVDLKLFAMQSGTFGPRFAVRFAPATFAVAVLVAVGVGSVLL